MDGKYPNPGRNQGEVKCISCVLLIPIRLKFDFRYRVDEVRFTDELPQALPELAKSPTLLLLNGVNSDSGKTTRTAAFDGTAILTVLKAHSLVHYYFRNFKLHRR